VFLLSVFLCLSLAEQTIPKDFKPQENKNEHTINKGIYRRDGQAFNNLSHPLSITGGGLILSGAALCIIGAETKSKERITSFFRKLYAR